MHAAEPTENIYGENYVTAKVGGEAPYSAAYVYMHMICFNNSISSQLLFVKQ